MKYFVLLLTTFLWAQDITCEKLENSAVHISRNIIINFKSHQNFSSYKSKYKLKLVKQVTANIYIYETDSIDKVCTIINELKNINIIKSIHPDFVKRNYLR